MFYNQNKLLPLSFITLLLSGCGSEGASTAQPSKLGKSSDYPTDELKVYITASGTADDVLAVTAQVQNGNYDNLLLAGQDKLVISVDGSETEVKYSSNSYHTAEVQQSSVIDEFSVVFTRADELISSQTINQLPAPFAPVSSYSNETIDLNWAPEGNVSYKLLGQMLVCSNGQVEFRREALPTYDGLPIDISSGQYSATLNTVFGAGEAELVAGYDHCQIEMIITAKLSDVFPVTQGGDNVVLDAGLKRTVSAILK